MSLMGKPPMGQKQPKPPKVRKALRKRSPKRETYMRSAEREDAVVHMLAVKALPCAACNAPPPSEAHHCTGGGMKRDDMATIPLCKPCHLAYHASKRTWVAKHGPDYGLLPKVAAMLASHNRLDPVKPAP